MSYLYLDVETIPGGGIPDPMTIPHPANMSKPATIEEWRRTKAPEAAEQIYRKQSLDLLDAQIVCACWAVEGEGIGSILNADEESLMGQLNTVLKAEFSGQRTAIFVGHNVRNFDLPLLKIRAQRYGLEWLAGAIHLTRGGNYADTMELVGNYKDLVSLERLCKYFGLGEPYGSGAQVYDWWMSGEHEEIREHCIRDVELERALFWKLEPGAKPKQAHLGTDALFDMDLPEKWAAQV